MNKRVEAEANALIQTLLGKLSQIKCSKQEYLEILSNLQEEANASYEATLSDIHREEAGPKSLTPAFDSGRGSRKRS